jgi:hypothetical protein
MHVGETLLSHLLRCEPCRQRVQALLAELTVTELSRTPSRWALTRKIVRAYPTQEAEA